MWYSAILKYMPYAVFLAVTSGISYFYIQGYKTGEEKCNAKMIESEIMWKNKIAELNTANEKILIAYQDKKAELEKVKKAKRKELLQYVEKDPSSDTIIFNDDILQFINSD